MCRGGRGVCERTDRRKKERNGTGVGGRQRWGREAVLARRGGRAPFPDGTAQAAHVPRGRRHVHAACWALRTRQAQSLGRFIERLRVIQPVSGTLLATAKSCVSERARGKPFICALLLSLNKLINCKHGAIPHPLITRHLKSCVSCRRSYSTALHSSLL